MTCWTRSNGLSIRGLPTLIVLPYLAEATEVTRRWLAGNYQLGDISVQLHDGAVRDGQGNLAGSALSMARAAQGFLEMVPSAGPWTLARLASANPADYLGLQQWGRIAPGQPAHFTLMTADRSMVALRY